MYGQLCRIAWPQTGRRGDRDGGTATLAASLAADALHAPGTLPSWRLACVLVGGCVQDDGQQAADICLTREVLGRDETPDGSTGRRLLQRRQVPGHRDERESDIADGAILSGGAGLDQARADDGPATRRSRIFRPFSPVRSWSSTPRTSARIVSAKMLAPSQLDA